MSDPITSREEFAARILNCPHGQHLDLQLFDGPTAIGAAPIDGRVFIFISEALGLHASCTPEIALRLSAELAWAALEVLGARSER